MGKYYSEEKVKSGNFERVYIIDHQKPRHNHRLVAIFDRLIFKVCVDVSKEIEWNEHYSQYLTGNYVSVQLYDVPFDVDIEK